MRGGEKVLEALCALLPEAEIFTLLHVRGRISKIIEGRPIHVSPLGRLPWVRRYYRWLLPWMPSAIERFDLRGFDRVVSSSHCVAKGALAPAGAPHLCYCHTPMRYVWDLASTYFPPQRWPWARGLLRRQLERLRRWDRDSSVRVDRFVANSAFVAERIQRCYDRTATVVHPPVDTEFFQPDPRARADYWLVVSALVPYKRVDLAIAACVERGERLLVVGDGPERRRLERGATEAIRFLGWVKDAELLELYRHCRALVFPGLEDFGIVPLEANACGKPVVGLAAGGLLESQIEGQTAVYFREPTGAALNAALEQFGRLRFEPAAIRDQALRFGRPRFAERIRQELDQLAR
jgi:glycosyltransferase involved in cell wall biosynthesis